jgi:SAM-dependent methyltransferase
MMRRNIRVLLPVVLMLLAMLSLDAIPKENAQKEKGAKKMRGPDVVYVGTAYDLVSIMLTMAQVKKEDMVYDLGCGDGRMLVLAAQKYGCHAVGYDIDPERVSDSIANAARHHVEKLVTIIQEDIFLVDLSNADVIPMYLLPEMNKRLLPQLDKLKKGARIVTHDYDLEDIVADKTITVISNEDNASHKLSLYTAPLKRK